MISVLFLGASLCGLAGAFDIKANEITDTMIAVYTPMKAHGFELDLERIPAYAKWVADRNITNVLPAGSNGESLSLTVTERKHLAEAWAKAGPANGLKVYMHIGSESIIEARELAEHSANLTGIAGLVAMTPVYFKPSVDSLVEFVAHVAAGAPHKPFWFYHFPDDTGVLPGEAHKFLERADKLGNIPNLMGIKYTDYNLMDFELCTQVAGGKYNMLYGRDEEALAGFMFGAAAAVSSTVGYSKTLLDAIRYHKEGNMKYALHEQERNAKLCSFFAQYEGAAANVQKNLMGVVGFSVGPSRLPKTDLSEEQLGKLKAELDELHLLG